MPQKKKVSEHKEEDAHLIRDTAIEIIGNKELMTNATGAKAIVEALKVLGRLQYLFQVDKQILKGSSKPPDQKPKLKSEHQELLDKIRNG